MSHQKKKILIIEKINRNYQRRNKTKQSSGLTVNTTMLVENLGHNLVTRAVVDNVNHIELAISEIKPEAVIITSLWMSDPDYYRLTTRFPKIKFFVQVHSNAPFLSAEGYAIHKIRNAQKLGVEVIFNDQRMKDAFPEKSYFLPNIYTIKEIERTRKPEKDSINIICAGALRALKNHSTQALGAILYAESIGKKLNFYCNLSRQEASGQCEMLLQGIFTYHNKHSLISFPWKEHDEFLNFLAKEMDLGLQVSISETFNIVAADYVAAKLPMVVSHEVKWASDEIKAETGSPKDIARKLKNAHKYTNKNTNLLQSHNAFAKGLWNGFITSL